MSLGYHDKGLQLGRLKKPALSMSWKLRSPSSAFWSICSVKFTDGLPPHCVQLSWVSHKNTNPVGQESTFLTSCNQTQSHGGCVEESGLQCTNFRPKSVHSRHIPHISVILIVHVIIYLTFSLLLDIQVIFQIFLFICSFETASRCVAQTGL